MTSVQNSNQQSLPGKRRSAKWAARVTPFDLAVIALGLLLWVRFIIATDHPRTAIAEPAEHAGAPITGQSAEVDR